jgi:hypothetical protein
MESLMSWIVSMRGSVLGTMKRTLWAPFTWDQTKRFPSDSRIFEKASGFRHVRKKYHQLQEGTNVFGILVSFFSEMVSAEPSCYFRAWENTEKKSGTDSKIIPKYRDVDLSNPSSFLRPFDYRGECSNVNMVCNRDFATDKLRQSMRFISLAQGCPEWFVLRMFCLTANTTSKSLKCMEKDDE